jgi:hypothetical protein
MTDDRFGRPIQILFSNTIDWSQFIKDRFGEVRKRRKELAVALRSPALQWHL